jgi:hypothetical protein
VDEAVIDMETTGIDDRRIISNENGGVAGAFFYRKFSRPKCAIRTACLLAGGSRAPRHPRLLERSVLDAEAPVKRDKGTANWSWSSTVSPWGTGRVPTGV